MLDGTYAVQMRTVLGPKSGTLTLNEYDDKLSGVLEIMGSKNPFTEGRLIGDVCMFSGFIRTALDIVPYQAEGRVEGDTINMLYRTSKGDIKLTGKRIVPNDNH